LVTEAEKRANISIGLEADMISSKMGLVQEE